jgi:hypothetical protein
VKVGAALDVVESGRGSGTFYRASEGAEQTEWRRSPAVSAPSRRLFSKVKWGKRSGQDAELVWGKWRRLASASIKLRLSTRGATKARGTAALGWSGPEWPGGRNATWAGAERKQNKKIEMGHKDDWAEMVLGYAEKKKKVFQILIQGIIFKSKFQISPNRI